MPLIIGLLIVMAAMYQFFFRYDRWESDKKPGTVYEYDRMTGETHTLAPEAKTSVFARIVGEGEESRTDDNGKEARLDKPSGVRRETATDGEGREQPLQETENAPVEAPRGAPVPGEPAERTETALLIPPETPGLNLKDHRQVVRAARAVPVPSEVVIASSAPPVPKSNIAFVGEEGPAREERNPFAVRQVDLDHDGSTEEIIQNAVQPDGLLDISIVKDGREIFYGRGKRIALLPSRNQGWADIALKMGAHTLQVFRYDAREAVYRMFEPNKS